MEYSNLRDEIAAIRQKLKSSEKYKYSTVHDELEALRQVIDSGSGGGGGAGLESITYAELKAKRDNGELTPGGQYRITDYVCTTTQAESRAVSNPFDIIVFADDESTLNENARAYRRHAEPTVAYDGELVVGEPGNMPFIYTQLDGVELPTLPSITVTYDGAEYILPKIITYGTVGYGYYIEAEDTPDFTIAPIFVDCHGSVMTPIDSTGTHALKIEIVADHYGFCSLEAWELKYCIDNDTDRFKWADTENGKGVIYYMKDDRNNECSYDFKQIQFKRYPITGVDMYTTLEHGDSIISIDEENPIWCYTFSAVKVTYNQDEEIAEMLDSSVLMDEENGFIAYDNKINRYIGYQNFESGSGSSCIYLNNIVFVDEPDRLDNSGHSNTFGDGCSNNTFGPRCISNTFGDGCSNNTLGTRCSSNTFGDGCYSITLGDYCSSNSLGNDCYNIEIESGSFSKPKQHYHVLNGVEGELLTLRITGTNGNAFETYVGKDSSGELKTWVPADLVSE